MGQRAQCPENSIVRPKGMGNPGEPPECWRGAVGGCGVMGECLAKVQWSRLGVV